MTFQNMSLRIRAIRAIRATRALRGFAVASLVFTMAALVGGCQQPTSGSSTVSSSGSTSGATSSGSSSSGSSGSSSSSTSSTTSTVNALQIITKADGTGSFDGAAVPAAGGITVKASRLYNLDGSLITSSLIPTWFSEARVFLTSTRTSGSNPSTPTTSDTPCAYFDSFTGDNNPDSNGFYTVDGYYSSTLATGGTDIDQCAGTAAAELGKLAMYVKIDRRFMNTTDKLQIIVKAKPLDAPNTAPTVSSCVVGGNFDPSACVNQLFTLTMRTAPNAAAKPFYILFPSAKALDLLSESVLLPISIDTSITTISVDRVKGGAIFYGMTVVRLQ